MTPPAALVIGSVVVVAGATFAFHQLIYEPHIAPKLEVLIENWFHDRRLRRRRLAPAVRVAENGVQARLKGTPPALEATEMETLTKAVKASGVETFIIDVPYERRKKPSRTHEHSVLEAPNSFIPFSALTPDANVKSDAKDTTNAALYSITSTPSTFSASLSGLQSPFSQHDSLTAVDADHSRANIDDPLADSVLSESRGLSVTSPSPVRSITHISPRALFIALSSPPYEPELPPSSSTREQARRRDTITLAPSNPGQLQGDDQSLVSPAGSSIYESALADSPSSLLPPSSPLHVFTTLSEGYSSGRETPKSSASWSDLASANGDDDAHFLIGSDDESWANVSDRMT